MAGKVFYATTIAGAIFIAIGITSSVYSGVPVDVPVDGVVRPGQIDVITPEMNVGNTASISVQGSSYEVTITDPEGRELVLEHGNTTFNYELTAQRDGEYRILVNNTGTTDLSIAGRAETKSSPLGLTGALMLIVTGVIVIGLGLRFRKN